MRFIAGRLKPLELGVSGNDTYGIWIEYESNPASCSGAAFILSMMVNNKTFVFSQALAAKSTDTNVCIQVYTLANIANRCRVKLFFALGF